MFHGVDVRRTSCYSVSPLGWDGVPHTQCADLDGAALLTARRRQQSRYPELASEHGRARLVVLACEGGREVVQRGSGAGNVVVRRKGRPRGGWTPSFGEDVVWDAGYVV